MDKQRIVLEQQLLESRQKEAYYKMLAGKAGKRSVREIDKLSRLFIEHKQTEEKLTIRLNRDNLFSSISTKLLELPCSEINDGIIWSLDKAGIFFEIDQFFILQINEHNDIFGDIYNWHIPEFLVNTDILKDFPLNECSWLLQKFRQNELFSVSCVNDVDDDILKEYITINHISSLVIVPKFSGDKVLDLMIFATLKNTRLWNEDDLTGFRMITDILANALARQRIEIQRQYLEEQLQIRQRMDSLGTLAGGIAHDFNNLLVAIMGNLDLLLQRESGLTDSQRDNINEAYKASQHAAQLTKEIQSLSSGGISQKSVIDIYDVAHDVFKILERTIDKLIEKKINIRPKQYYVHANADQLHQVLLNLGTNSAHAIMERGVKKGDCISITVKKYSADNNDKRGLTPGTYAHISFTDTGIGMSNEIRQKAFDPMFTTRRGSRKGQGLGLAMVYNIVTKSHHGFIDIESQPGQNTTVHIYLPSAQIPAQNNAQDIVENINGNEMILLIEDEDSVREAVTKTLQFYGYNVLSAVDGEEGLFKFKAKEDAIDLVLLDLTMPKISGEIVFQRILEIRPNVKVLITSGHSAEKMIKFSRAKGFLPKPYQIKTLGKMVRHVLDKN
ncbi:MAG: response regulator [Candidatus Latescibacteria bacterium]|nr:response regulator [Candidatus Latescibacterota bacterium]